MFQFFRKLEKSIFYPGRKKINMLRQKSNNRHLKLMYLKCEHLDNLISLLERAKINLI